MIDKTDPTNRDTVPAMLTPGEFVLNKEASTMFAPQIEAMNNAGLQHRQAKNNGGEIPGFNAGGSLPYLPTQQLNRGGQAGLFAGQDWDKYANVVGGIESGGEYDIRGGSGNHYVGKYQLGTDAIKDAAKRLGIKAPSKDELQSNPDLQEKLFRSYTEQNHEYLMKKQPDLYASMSPRDQQEVLGYAHNQGAGGASKWLKTGVAGKDGFGTSGTKYSEALSGAWEGGTGQARPTAPVPQQQAAPPQQAAEQQAAQAAQSTPAQDVGAAVKQQASQAVMNAIMPQQQAPVQHMGGGRQMSAPEYVPSVTEKEEMQGRNMGGNIQELNIGGWLKNLFGRAESGELAAANRATLDGPAPVVEGPNAGYANYSPEQFVSEANNPNSAAADSGFTVPGLSPDAPPVPGFGGQNSLAPKPLPDGSIDKVGGQAGALRGRITGQQLQNSAGNDAAFNAPSDPSAPIPGSDEALLQGSSQSVEAMEDNAPPPAPTPPPAPAASDLPPDLQEAYGGIWPQLDEAGKAEILSTNGYTPGATTPQSGAVASGLIGPDSAPSPEYVEAQAGEVTGEFPARPSAEEAGKAVSQRLDEGMEIVSQEPSPLAGQGTNPNEGATTNEIAVTGEEKATPQQKEEGMSVIKEAFGDLVDKKELARMGILFAGALVTGASPAQALSMAGQSYLGRVDAKNASHKATVQKLATGGKYTPASVETYKETKNLADLMASDGVSPFQPQGTTKSFTIGGKKVVAESFKNKDTGAVQYKHNGKTINLSNAQEYDPKFDRSTSEYQTHRRGIQGDIAKRLKETIENQNYGFDSEGKKKDQGYTTIGAEAGASAFFNYAEEIGMDPGSNEAQQLYSNAMEEAIAQGRGDKKNTPGKLRPFLEAQFIRQTTKAADQFKLGGGRFVSPKKMGELQNNVTYFAGLAGDRFTPDQVWTAGLTDWTSEDLAVRKEWDDKAKRQGGSESGYYLFMENKLTELATQL